MSTLYATGLTLCSALVAAGAATVLRANGDAAVSRAAPLQTLQTPARVEPATRPAEGAALGIGDLLKITFYETIDIPGGTPAGRSGADTVLQTFYQRMDLSGDYTVDQEGVVSVPRLGKFIVEGTLPRAFEAQLAAAFARASGRSVEINVAIQERRPVYVVGAVRSSGALKHAGQMIVLQAIALSGGIDPGLGNASELIEGVREQERMTKFTHQLKRLLAHRARLEAERSGRVTLEAPEQLVALVGAEDAEAALASERALLELDQSRREQQRTEADANVAAAQKEVAAMRAKLLQLDAQSQVQGEHLNDLRKLEGLTTRTSVIRSRSEISEIEARRQDAHAALAMAESKLAQAEGALARLAIDHASELAKSIAATDAEISEVRVALNSAALLAGKLGEKGSMDRRQANAAQPVYEIVRQGRDGPTILPAEEGTLLLPGDVLKVRLEVSSEAPTASFSRRAAATPW